MALMTFRKNLTALLAPTLLLTPWLLGCDKKAKEEASSSAVSDAQTKTSTEPAKPAPSGPSADELTLPLLPDMPIPEDNPQSEHKVSLGHRLFFDERLSGDGKLSCYSCHQNENGTGGADKTAVGSFGKKLPRHSPVILNAGYLPKFYWDGRADTLEAQVKGAWGGPNMGVGADNLDTKAKQMAALPEYKQAFAEAFPGETPNGDTVAKALSAYTRTLTCKDTAYDKYAAGDKSALSEEQKAGLSVFMGKAMCSACHAPPFFSTAYLGQSAFFNVGIGTKGVPEDDVDIGRMKVTEKETDWAAFKPPTLRNVTRSAPYFHDGSMDNLKDAVVFMASGGYDNKNKTPLMSDKKLTATEVDQIVSFLGALECKTQLEAPKR